MITFNPTVRPPYRPRNVVIMYTATYFSLYVYWHVIGAQAE